jgi:predicted transcriptional regulator
MAAPAVARELPPRLELDCLKALWSLGEANVRQVRQALAAERDLAYTTVMTIMDRLARRGCVRRRKTGRSFVYSPVLTREEVRSRAIRDLIDCYFEGSNELLRIYLDGPAPDTLSGVDGGQDSRLDAALL